MKVKGKLINDSLTWFSRSGQTSVCFRILIQLLLNEQKYPFVSLSASAINLLCIIICFNPLLDSTVELWSNQFGNTPDGLLLGIVYIYMVYIYI